MQLILFLKIIFYVLFLGNKKNLRVPFNIKCLTDHIFFFKWNVFRILYSLKFQSVNNFKALSFNKILIRLLGAINLLRLFAALFEEPETSQRKFRNINYVYLF